jgi:hypothetical protein
MWVQKNALRSLWGPKATTDADTLLADFWRDVEEWRR